LLLPGDRKSVKPMAARVQLGRVQAAHQSLHHLADWSDEAVLAALRACVLPIIEQHGPTRALMIDDTGIPKKGTHSVGVARQYCGQLGKQDNCQVPVSLSAANDHARLPIAYRLYLPHEWADDPDRRSQAGVPDEIVFQTKPQIALDQLRAARAAGIEAEVVLAGAGYGADTDFRDGIIEIRTPSRHTKPPKIRAVCNRAPRYRPVMAPPARRFRRRRVRRRLRGCQCMDGVTGAMQADGHRQPMLPMPPIAAAFIHASPVRAATMTEAAECGRIGANDNQQPGDVHVRPHH
jgi:hypothetical protein